MTSCGRNMVIKSGRFGRFLACPGYPECKFTKPLVVEMPGRCPKCGGRLMKRTGISKKTGKQYTYYCCEKFPGRAACDFVTFDVPVKDDCPVCGHTMFKKSGRGFKRPFCINPACENFLPEDKRGYPKKTTEREAPAAETAEPEEEAKTTGSPQPRKPRRPRKPPQRPLQRKPAAKTTATKKPPPKRPQKKDRRPRKSCRQKRQSDAVMRQRKRCREIWL